MDETLEQRAFRMTGIDADAGAGCWRDIAGALMDRVDQLAADVDRRGAELERLNRTDPPPGALLGEPLVKMQFVLTQRAADGVARALRENQHVIQSLVEFGSREEIAIAQALQTVAFVVHNAVPEELNDHE